MQPNHSLNLSGVIPPMIAPLTADGAVDEAGVDRLVDYLLASGCSGLFILGSSGEGPWLSAAQRETLIRRTVRAAAGRVPVLVGALEPGIERTLEALSIIEAQGADAVVLASPYYFGADADAQLQHFEQVAAASRLPIVLYNIPQMTHNPIAVATVRTLLERCDNIIAIKDSAGNMDDFEGFLRLREQRPDFRVFQGAEKLAARAMLAGADGLVPGLGNIAPRWFVEIYEAGRAGRESDAVAAQERIEQLWSIHTHDYWLVCLKYAASLLGFGSGATCGHPSHLTEEDKAAIQARVATVTPVSGD